MNTNRDKPMRAEYGCHPPSRPVRGRRRARLIAPLLAGIVLTTLTAASCGGETPLSLGNASLGTVAELVEAPATVTAQSAVTLSAPTAGTLAALYVNSGDAVKTGRVLALIDSPEAEEQLAQAKAALDAANRARGGFGGGADLSGLQQTTNRAAAKAFAAAREAGKRISDPGVRDALLAQAQAAQKQYDAAARAAGAAIRSVQRGVGRLSSAISALSAAQRLQAKQAYDLAKATVDALVLRAPMSGVVQLGAVTASGSALAGVATFGAVPGRLNAAAGSLTGGTPAGAAPGLDGTVPVGGRVAAGTPVLTVVDTAHPGVVAEVDETDVMRVRPGLTASIEVDAAQGASYTSKVRSVDVLPTASARGGVSYRVRLSLGAGTFADGRDAPPPWPGMSAIARLRMRQANDAVTVPAAAVVSVKGHDAVWVVRNGRAEQMVVTVGVRGQGLVQIVSGVQPGQQVIVRGTDQVRQGEHVS